MKNRLSIITICYNDRAALERTFASVFAQTAHDFEYIVVDGGSTDGSVEMIERNRERITRWVSEKDAGIYDAQNKGWRMGSAPYVLFLNAGDILAGPDVIERALPALSPNVDIAYGDAQLSRAHGTFATKTHPARITTPWLMKEVVAHQSQFIRRGLLERLNGYDHTYRIAADYAFFARAFWTGPLKLVKLPFIVSVFDVEGLSSDPAQKEAVARERKAVQARYAPKLWYWGYHAYAAFNRMIGR
jgi:glycosyltransferase involved in cell wall biosynthesis